MYGKVACLREGRREIEEFHFSSTHRFPVWSSHRHLSALFYRAPSSAFLSVVVLLSTLSYPLLRRRPFFFFGFVPFCGHLFVGAVRARFCISDVLERRTDGTRFGERMDEVLSPVLFLLPPSRMFPSITKNRAARGGNICRIPHSTKKTTVKCRSKKRARRRACCRALQNCRRSNGASKKKEVARVQSEELRCTWLRCVVEVDVIEVEEIRLNATSECCQVR